MGDAELSLCVGESAKLTPPLWFCPTPPHPPREITFRGRPTPAKQTAPRSCQSGPPPFRAGRRSTSRSAAAGDRSERERASRSHVRSDPPGPPRTPGPSLRGEKEGGREESPGRARRPGYPRLSFPRPSPRGTRAGRMPRAPTSRSRFRFKRGALKRGALKRGQA